MESKDVASLSDKNSSAADVQDQAYVVEHELLVDNIPRSFRFLYSAAADNLTFEVLRATLKVCSHQNASVDAIVTYTYDSKHDVTRFELRLIKGRLGGMFLSEKMETWRRRAPLDYVGYSFGTDDLSLSRAGRVNTIC
jgi:hypothetical protein